MQEGLSVETLVFGRAAKPVKCGFGLTLGNGTVIPEVNYTLPPTRVDASTFADVRAEYRRMVAAILARAGDLAVPGIVLEFEQPFDLTQNPEWGATVTGDSKAELKAFHDTTGIPCALRVTIADIRDLTRPPRMRTGVELRTMEAAFRKCGAAGADLLAIESTGGKELTDEALTECDLRGLMFGMLVAGGRDMAHLWDRIVAIARETGSIPSGDSACGFGNTAMRLADTGYIPKVFAAVVRAASAARSAVAFEHGAVGPGKDCAYENAYLKALYGVPIAMEGKSAACAHFSHIGNVAAAYADLWSNESVQNVRLLAGFAPEVFTEVLAYDCRLMNTALAEGDGAARRLRDWLAASDTPLDPQAWVLGPAGVGTVVAAMAGEQGPWRQGLAAARAAAEGLAAASGRGELRIAERERPWLDRIRSELADLPPSEEELIRQALPDLAPRFLPAEYGLPLAGSGKSV